MTAVLAWLALVLVPGAALAVAVWPAAVRSPVLVLGMAPALAAATAAAVAWCGDLVGVGPWPAVLVVDAVVVAVASVRGARHRGRVGAARDGADASPRWARGLLLAAVLLTGVVWLLPPGPVVPLNRDTQNHAYFVARIAAENSVDPAVVLADSPTHEVAVAAFYPLGAHTTMAVAHRATGAPVRSLQTVWTMLAAAVVLPCGLFTLGRRLAPGRPGVAGFAALAGACLAAFPYQPLAWGGVAFIVGTALVPGALALCLEAVDRRRAPPTVLAAIAVTGVTAVHTSATAVLGVALVALAVTDVARSPGDGTRRRSAASWASLGGLSAVLLIPWLAGMASGAAERVEIAETLDEPLPDVAGRLLALSGEKGPGQLAMGLLAVAGVVVLVAGRRARPIGRYAGVLAALGVFVLLFASVTATGPPWDQLRPGTLPWYQSSWRLLYNLAVLVPLLAAVALDRAREVLAERTARSGALAATAVAVALAAVALPVVGSTLRAAGDRSTDFGPDEVALFRRAAERAPTGGAVLNQENDGSVWMYPVAAAPAFSGLVGREATTGSEDRRYLLDHVDDVATDQRARALVERYRIRDVVVSDGTYGDEPAAMTPETLQDAGFAVVDRAGIFWLLEVPGPAPRSG